MTGNPSGPRDGEIAVYFADLRSCRGSVPDTVLGPDETARALRYRSPVDSLRYRQARCLLREVLSWYRKCDPEAIVFGYTVHGKPFLDGEPTEGVQFSLSHAGDMVAVAVSRGRSMGIDIEQFRDGISASDLSLRFFSREEAAAIRNLQERAAAELFLRLWTRKEALLKATGEGIGGLPGCPALLHTGEISVDGRTWQLLDLCPAPGYFAALAAEGTGSSIRIARLPAPGIRSVLFPESGD